MKVKGMGRTRMGRLAAVTIPATALSAGLGFAILQGMVAAQLSSADAFQVKGDQAVASGLEVSMRGVSAADTQNDATPTKKKSALVTLKDGKVTNMCLAANQNLPVLGAIGLKLKFSGAVDLGDIDLNTDSVVAGTAVLPKTDIGVAQSELDHQKDVADGYQAGAFGLESGNVNPQQGDVTINGLDADAYGITLSGLNLTSGLSITPELGTADCNVTP